MEELKGRKQLATAPCSLIFQFLSQYLTPIFLLIKINLINASSYHIRSSLTKRPGSNKLKSPTDQATFLNQAIRYRALLTADSNFHLNWRCTSGNRNNVNLKLLCVQGDLIYKKTQPALDLNSTSFCNLHGFGTVLTKATTNTNTEELASGGQWAQRETAQPLLENSVHLYAGQTRRRVS